MSADNLETLGRRRIRFGILGCARIARRGLIPGIRGSHHATLDTIAGRNLANVQAWASEFQIPATCSSYEELIASPTIDAVYIPLPNELHRPWVEAAAAAGKHILCEKPLALDSQEANHMVEYCRARGVVLMEAFMWRHQARSMAVRRLVRSGAIGELRLIRSSFSFTIDLNDWRLDPARGGGSLWDVGCYGLNTARFFAGAEPIRIEAVGRFGPTGVDLGLTAALAFPDGVLATFDCAFDQPFRCAYELVGASGTIEVPDAYLPPAKPFAIIRRESQSEQISFDSRDQYAAMVDSFCDAIENHGRLVDPAEDGQAQMVALETVLRAASGS